MSLIKPLYPLLSPRSTQEDLSQHDWKIVDWDIKNQNRQSNLQLTYLSTVVFTAFHHNLSERKHTKI